MERDYNCFAAQKTICVFCPFYFARCFTEGKNKNLCVMRHIARCQGTLTENSKNYHILIMLF